MLKMHETIKHSNIVADFIMTIQWQSLELQTGRWQQVQIALLKKQPEDVATVRF